MKKIIINQKVFITPIVIAIVAILAIGAVVYFAPEKQVETPDMVNINNDLSGISVKVPESADVSLDTNGTTRISFGVNYYLSFDFSTTTTKYLTDIYQNSITVGVAPLKSSECSLLNYSPKGDESTSTDVIKINNSPFYIVETSDNGMNQYFNTKKYIQILDNNNCRYISYYKHLVNAGVYSEEYWEKTNSVYQKIMNEIETKNIRFYSADDMFQLISVQPFNRSYTKAKIGETILVNGVKIKPLEIVEDSRCSKDVTCVWAGTVVLKTEIGNQNRRSQVNLTLNKPLSYESGKEITLIAVSPEKMTPQTINNSDYEFNFLVK